MDNKAELDLLNKGRVYFEQREYHKSQSILSEVVEINPKNIEAIFILANIFNINGQLNKSIKAFLRVLELDPDHTDAAISLSVLYNDTGRYNLAKEIFDRAKEKVKKHNYFGEVADPHINKKFSQKHLELADLYMAYNRFDEALFEYDKGIKLDDTNLEGRVKVAKVYAKKGYISKAFEELKRIKSENPHYLLARIALGILYYGNGNVIEAQNEWQKILQIAPNNADARMYLNLSNNAEEACLSLASTHAQ